MIATYTSVYNEVVPDEPLTEDEVRRGLERNPERRLFARGDDAAAMVTRSGVPRCASVYVWVRPAARGRGLGTSLYDEAVAYARTIDEVDGLFAKARGTDELAVAFAERRGFEEIGREVELVRRLRNSELQAPAPPDGVEVVALREEHHRGAYAVAVEATPDMPFDPPLQAEPFDRWREEELTGPAAFVALEDGRVVGYTSLHAHKARPGVLEHGLTAVLRSHRRRGIASALKQQAIAWAAAEGHSALTTWTQDGNEAMQAVNVRLGFEPQPARWIMMRAPLA